MLKNTAVFTVCVHVTGGERVSNCKFHAKFSGIVYERRIPSLRVRGVRGSDPCDTVEVIRSK